MTTIHFNTGRAYSAAGQRISATKHEDGCITFYDHDRMIYGEIGPGRDLTQRDVTQAYDLNMYRSTTRSWSDGMMAEGANSKWVQP